MNTKGPARQGSVSQARSLGAEGISSKLETPRHRAGSRSALGPGPPRQRGPSTQGQTGQAGPGQPGERQAAQHQREAKAEGRARHGDVGEESVVPRRRQRPAFGQLQVPGHGQDLLPGSCAVQASDVKQGCHVLPPGDRGPDRCTAVLDPPEPLCATSSLIPEPAGLPGSSSYNLLQSLPLTSAGPFAPQVSACD